MAPSDFFSTERYINGLREADTDVLNALYPECRPFVVQAIADLGGSESEGVAFFQAALVEAARLARLGQLSGDVPFALQLRALASAHYRDWLDEHGQPSSPVEPNADEMEASIAVPTSEELRDTRQKISDWKKGERADEAGYLFWEKVRIAEHHWQEAAKPAPTPPSKSFRNLFLVLALLTAALLVWSYFTRSKTPAQLYDEHFQLPESIMSDVRTRYGPERGNDSVTARPNACELILREADEFYKVKDYKSAQAVLFDILEDSLTVCHSDALYYIGIIAVEQQRPGLALECFAKIEDLDRFGEDIYWYQALALVQAAANNPLLRDKAVRAVNRARSNAQDPMRREQAEKMLKHLSE
ncbi:MAG: hypothetical protein KIS77_21670 [Saprospiraceae bacterium]|nr:hypothetical protein [Saprospiraceae bacterium]